MPVFKSSRKVQSLGSSLAVTLPALFCKACEIKKGVKAEVFYNLNGTLIISLCDDPRDLIINLSEIYEDVEEKLNSSVLKEKTVRKSKFHED